MIRAKMFWALFALALLTFACQNALAPGATQPAPTIMHPGQPVITAPATQSSPEETENPVRITILYTNDEHGWMEGMKEGQGAANLVGLLRASEGYGKTPGVVLVSGGDNWVGPAISTWFQGRSMVEVMNVMGYATSTIGNHEFDFGIEALKARLAEARFPYLSANLRYQATGRVPTDIGIQPYAILQVGPVKLGVIGLTTSSTTTTTNPVNLRGLEFIDYTKALREVVPQARQEGADVVVVSAHICTGELIALAEQVKELGISVMGAGHCHEVFSTRVGDTAIISGGSNYSAYAYAHLTYEPESRQVTELSFGTRQNTAGAEDQAVAQVIAHWKQQAQGELNLQIGFLKHEVARRSPEMQSLITETWLVGYPSADIALTNLGGMRDRLPAGPITMASIISVMPFNDTLVSLRLTGAQVLKVLNFGQSSLAVGGLSQKDGKWVIKKDGAPLDPERTYTVLVNDFMYAGGDKFTMLKQYDPGAYMTGIDWRQPVIDWIKAQNSTPARPLDPAIASLEG